MNNTGKNQDAEQRSPQEEDAYLGLAGRTARFFISSPLSPLFFFAMMLLGIMGLVLAPRQEDPQISVPMVDVFVQFPGASAEQVSSLAIEPLERIMSEIPDVKHVYSASQRGQGMVTIEFEVGEDMGPSLVKVNDKIDSNMDRIPPGVMPPLVKAKGIDDVPVVNITLWSKDMDGNGKPDVDDGQLRMLAHDVLQSVKEIPNTGNGFVVGGRSEQIKVEVYPERLSGFNISLDQVANTIKTANSQQQAGGVESGSVHFSVITGSFLETIEDISRLMVGTNQNIPVYVHDVARVTQGPEDAKKLVAYYTGSAGSEGLKADGVPAVTIAVAKKKGTNGVTVANAIIERVNSLRGSRIPSNVEISITRDYGATANDKVQELIFKLFVATGFVFLLVLAAFRALKPAIVVVLVIPVVLLFTIFVAFLTGYTIDRVSLFALIFSIGILVDDAIVVVENIYRRWLEDGDTSEATAVDAVREVGNPTILATFTVIGALLPMGFVTGMMGPYMEPIPALGSVAMLVSLFAAFVFTPWLSISPALRPSMKYLEHAERREHKEAEWLEGLYRRVLMPMIEDPRKARNFRLVMWGVFLLMCSMFYFKLVAVKMLPLDNKPEFAVVLDMPEGTALPVTVNMAHTIASRLREMPEVTALQVYAGTARPFDFNGMVRHYYLRSEPWQGEIQVQLLHKNDRERSSHEIAVAARKLVTELVQGSNARFAVVEMPPGPPVLQSVVAEVHGPDPETRRQVARDLTGIFSETDSLRDVDNYLRDRHEYWRFHVDTEKAVRRGISVDAINRNLSMALGGASIGDAKQRAGHEPVNIVLQVPLAERSQISRLGDLPILSQRGVTLPLRELGYFERVPEDDIIYHKDLRPVEYVVAEVGGRLAAPVYGMLQVQDLVAENDYVTPDGVRLHEGGFFWIGPPEDDKQSSVEWTGEWTVTYETFRDMGIAFAAALVLIYMLVVWEFSNFRIPALIMAPIPLTLLGIIPAHMLFFQAGWGGEFTATSMIGWIALAGIIVRNSILLVDFSIHEIQKGEDVVEAVIRACKTRTRPIMITALALVCGSSVIFFDPIFQGMAISLASGVMVSTILTLIVIPLGCISASDSLYKVAEVAVPKQEPGVGKPSAGSRDRKGRNLGEFVWLLWSVVASILLLLVRVIGSLWKMIGGKKEAAQSPSGGRKSGSGSIPIQSDTRPVQVAGSQEDRRSEGTVVAVSGPVESSSVSDAQEVASAPTDTTSAAKVIMDDQPTRSEEKRSETSATTPLENTAKSTRRVKSSVKKKKIDASAQEKVTKASAPEKKAPVTSKARTKPSVAKASPKKSPARKSAPKTSAGTVASVKQSKPSKPEAPKKAVQTETKPASEGSEKQRRGIRLRKHSDDDFLL